MRSFSTGSLPQHLGYWKKMVAGRFSNTLFMRCTLLPLRSGSSLSRSRLSLRGSLSIQTELRVFLLSDFPSFGLTFMHLLLTSWILELILRISSLVMIFFFYWMMEDEKGFKDLRVVWESLVLTGLIRIWLTRVGNRLFCPSLNRQWLSTSIYELEIKLCTSDQNKNKLDHYNQSPK